MSGDHVGTTGTAFAFADKNAGAGKTLTVSGTALTGADAGNYTFTIPASALADIFQKALAGTVIVNSKTYDGIAAGTGTVTLNGVVSGDAIGTTGTIITFADKNAGTGKTVAITGTTLTGADAGNYTMTLPASALADIFRKAITGSVTVNSKTYDGITNATGTVALDGVVGGDAVGTAGTVLTFDDKKAGTGKTVTVSGTTLTGGDAGNYTLTITTSALADILKKAISGTAAVDSKTYDGTTNGTGSVALNGVVAGDTVSATGTVFTFADKNAGAGKTVSITGTTLSGDDAQNYTLAIPSTMLADIFKKSITGNVAVDSKAYDGTTSATGMVTLNDLVAGDAVGTNGTLLSFADKNAGTGKAVTISGTALIGADGGNYTLALPSSALADILKKAITATVTVADRAYDGTTSATGTTTLNGVIAGDSVGTVGTVFSFADKNAGAGKAVAVSGTTLTGGDAGNYTLTVPASVLGTISRRQVDIRPDDITKDQGTPDPALTFTISGGSLVTGDSLTGALGRAAGELPGNYAILIGTLTGGANYDLHLQGGTFMIVTRLSDSIGELQALRVVMLPAQIPDLSASGAAVTVGKQDICGTDETCTTGN
ncbi:hypothetical protein H3Z74_11890 [Sphingomonas alpina]|uniref:Uncharacterized protein n=1 Tax=Sphingomonas alpina TaxID=653931 RepID=A0A7H0LQ14_9SPHN|nr:hypothetical protein H3Z74_11890 [Sphingomonas alpina]